MTSSISVLKSIFYLIQSSHSRSTIFITVLTLIGCFVVFTLAGRANSMALQAFCSLCIFDLLFIGTALLSAWIIENNNSKVRQKIHHSNSFHQTNDSTTSLFIPSQTIATFSYGTARFEVLAVFTSTMLSILGAFFILKESIEKYLEDEAIHPEYISFTSLITFAIHLIVIYFVPNQAFDHCIAASSSSWLQEHVSDMFQSVCHYIPGLSRLLLPRINPLALLCWCGLAISFSDSFLLQMGYGNFVDTLSSLLMAFMTFGTMVPMATYSGKILLQTTPAPMIGQLDKCLHEALRLDGVLQFRNEHFWALSFGTLVGSLHVRCRRDADEQLVLAHVWNKLANVVQILTIHIFKDDWLHRQTHTFMHHPHHQQQQQQQQQPQHIQTGSPYPSATTINAHPPAYNGFVVTT